MDQAFPYTPPGPPPPPNTFLPSPTVSPYLAPSSSTDLEILDSEEVGQLVYASWGRRAGALFLDGAILGLVFLPVLAVFSAIAAGLGLDLGLFASLGAPILAMIAWAGYTLGTMTRGGSAAGQTFGKQLMDIRVVRTDQQQLNVQHILVRETLAKGILDMTSLGILLNYLWPLWDPERQTLHDKVAKTVVVSTQIPALPAPALAPALMVPQTSLESADAVEAFFDDYQDQREPMPVPRSQPTPSTEAPLARHM